MKRANDNRAYLDQSQIGGHVGRYIPSTAKVADNMKDTAWLLLDEHGIIRECHGSYDAVFERHKSDIVAKHVATLLPELVDIPLLHEDEPNHRLRLSSRIGVRFHVLNKRGERFPCDIFLGRLRNAGVPPLRMVVHRVNDLLVPKPVAA